MIKIINLTKIFRTESVQTTALNEVSLETVSYTHLTLPTNSLV